MTARTLYGRRWKPHIYLSRHGEWRLGWRNVATGEPTTTPSFMTKNSELSRKALAYVDHLNALRSYRVYRQLNEAHRLFWKERP